nr:S24 family peptidase [Tetragenococcus halophilus]
MPEDITTIYNQLNSDRQTKVYNYAQHELEEQNKIIDVSEYQENDIYLQSLASAGTGILDLDPTYGEYVPYEGEVPNHYDLAFKISGNSMVPTFEDGEIIFVEKYPNPINGAIMVVQIDEQAYIKKVYLEKDNLRLVSLNQDYDDILADGNNNIRIVGKVVF